MSSGKSKTMPMQIFWGVEAVYYGIVQVERSIMQLYYQREDCRGLAPFLVKQAKVILLFKIPIDFDVNASVSLSWYI